MSWWFISARKWFTGPRVNVNHLMLGRDGNTIEGETKDDASSSEGHIVPEKGVESAELKSG
jgi:hypothetical protein